MRDEQRAYGDAPRGRSRDRGVQLPRQRRARLREPGHGLHPVARLRGSALSLPRAEQVRAPGGQRRGCLRDPATRRRSRARDAGRASRSLRKAG